MADFALGMAQAFIAIGIYVGMSKVLARLLGERYGYYKEEQ